MRLLADENFPRTVVAYLRQLGLDVRWARIDYVGWADSRLLDLAEQEGRILLTIDRDFWQIALQRREPLVNAGVILFRIHPATAARIQPVVSRILAMNQDWTGGLTVATEQTVQRFTARR